MTMRLLMALALLFSVGNGVTAAEEITGRAVPNAPVRKPRLPVPPPLTPVPISYPDLNPSRLSQDLAAISTMIADGKPTPAILEAWKGYVTRQVRLKNPFNVQETIQQVPRQAEAQVRVRTDAQVTASRNRRSSVGDDAQLANVDLQNLLQKQQQTLQMLSNISKMMHDTAMETIRKIGG